MTDTIHELQQQAARASAEAGRLQAVVQQQQAEARQRGEDARTQWDREFMANWPAIKAQAEAELAQAEQDFRQAVLDTPLCQAYIRWRAARVRAMAVQADARGIGIGIHSTATPTSEMNWRFPELLESLLPVLEQEATNLGRQDSEDRWAQRAEVEQAAQRGDA